MLITILITSIIRIYIYTYIRCLYIYTILCIYILYCVYIYIYIYTVSIHIYYTVYIYILYIYCIHTYTYCIWITGVSSGPWTLSVLGFIAILISRYPISNVHPSVGLKPNPCELHMWPWNFMHKISCTLSSVWESWWVSLVYQWIGLRENLQESPIFNGKIDGFL